MGNRLVWVADGSGGFTFDGDQGTFVFTPKHQTRQIDKGHDVRPMSKRDARQLARRLANLLIDYIERGADL